MAINNDRIQEMQTVFNRFYDGFSKRHTMSMNSAPKEVIAGWLIAASNLTVAYYTEAGSINVAGELRDAGIGVQR